MKEASNTSPLEPLVAHLFRHESGKMLSALTRLLGFQNLEVAQDIVQDSLLQALNAWRFGTVPDNPAAWLYRVAKNKAIDHLRRQKRIKNVEPQYAYLLESEYYLASTMNSLFVENEIRDSQLRMIYACCHPSIPEESQIALVLKTLCGLSVAEIARAFISNDDTIAKRIFRAKEKIRSEGIEMEVPVGEELFARTNAVLHSIYLLFNEGYHSSHPDQLIRSELCEEAMRLCHLLTQNELIRRPRIFALLALMHFQASRLNTRLDDEGNITLLKHQDRARWNRSLITRGFELLERAAEPFETSTYHLEAAIAAIHASAPSFEQTDWKSIYDLYELLYQYQPNPVVALNKAIASAYAVSRQHAIEELKRIKGLEKHHLYFASLGEIYLELDERKSAKDCFEKALYLTTSQKEQQLLRHKIARCN